MSDIGVTFGTDGWRARGEEFTIPRVRAIGRATVSMLDSHGHAGPLAIGYDSRQHSQKAAQALAEAVSAGGRDVVLAQRDCPTPTLAWTVNTGPYAGGLMVTASHNPPEYNGVKFVTETGAPALPPVTDELEARLSTATDGTDTTGVSTAGAETSGHIGTRNLRNPYLDGIRGIIEADLAGLTVAYDAMHGSGRGVTDTVLSQSGATVERVRCSRDVSFGGVAPEPGPETASELERLVDAGACDIGIINDGDADRVGVVTPERGYLDPNVLLAVLYRSVLASRSGDVVRTVSTSSLVDRIAEARGQSVHETPVGFKWVAEAMTDHEALMGGEESGGYGLTEHLPNKDGVLIALLACATHRERPLDARIDDILTTHGPVHQRQVSVACADEDRHSRVDAIATDPPTALAGTEVTSVSTVDGVKLVLSDGAWVLVRPSGTEPKLRIYAEASDKDRLSELLAAGEALV